VLLFYASRQKQVPFRHMFWLFGLFILSCGFTHFLDYYTFSTPMYRLSGLVKLITALASWATVFAIIPMTPVALAMRTPEELERLVDERTEQLQDEVEHRREAERLLRERQEEIERLNDSLEIRVAERTQDLATANEELESFAYSVSHDLRQPLRAIDGFSFAIHQEARERLTAEEVAMLERVRTATQRMDVLITSLLKLSRLYRAQMKFESVNLSELAAQILEDFQEAEPERRIRFEVEPGLTAGGDPTMLRVLLVNLLGNAWKFTAREDEATIAFGREGEEFFVRDNGAGFDEAYADKLFLPFERLHRDSEFEGSGVGLATVERIVRRHGGKVRAQGVVGEGATFYFWLPEASSDANSE
jgi:signal transduction histidine kinase